MKIAYGSDLHLEFEAFSVKNTKKADVLVLAGDICIAEDIRRHPGVDVAPDDKRWSPRLRNTVMYREFFRQCAHEFETVIYVMGNHEHYGCKFEQTKKILQDELTSIAPNIHLLENETLNVNGILFFGATLWTDANKSDPHTVWELHQFMNDYKTIRVAADGYRKLRVSDTVHEHHTTKSALQRILRDNYSREDSLPIVVVTHHLPTYESIPARFRHYREMNGGYASDLSDLILSYSDIKYWICGYTHDKHTYTVGDTTVLCNPRGYPSESWLFRFQVVDI